MSVRGLKACHQLICPAMIQRNTSKAIAVQKQPPKLQQWELELSGAGGEPHVPPTAPVKMAAAAQLRADQETTPALLADETERFIIQHIARAPVLFLPGQDCKYTMSLS